MIYIGVDEEMNILGYVVDKQSAENCWKKFIEVNEDVNEEEIFSWFENYKKEVINGNRN